MRRLMLVLLVACPAVADAKPVYLSCTFAGDNKQELRKFTLDEDAAKVTIFYPETSETQTVAAGFSAERVMFETYVDRYGIDRVISMAVRQDKLTNKIVKAPCQIDAPAKRAF